MWEDLIQKAKDGGLDVVETYVFWNVHEPTQGTVWNYFSYSERIFVSSLSSYAVMALLQYNFEGRYDLVRFIKTIQKAGLYAHIRIGPYVCAEWNFGYWLNPIYQFCFVELSILWWSDSLCLCRGFPVWLKYVPGISFRTNNEPFKVLSVNIFRKFVKN